MKTITRTQITVFFSAVFIFLLAFRAADPCSISGVVLEKNTGDALISANVILSQNGKQLAAMVTDVDGKFCFPNLADGNYDIAVKYIGCIPFAQKGILVKDGKSTALKIVLNEDEKSLNEVVVTGSKYEKKLSEETVSQDVISMDYDIVSYNPVKNAPGVDYLTISSRTRKGRSSNKGMASASKSAQGAGVLSSPNYDLSAIPEVYKPDADGELKPAVKQDDVISNKEEYDRIVENDFLKPTDKALSTFSIDVDVASYGMMRKKLEEHQMPPKESIRLEEMINYFTYGYANPTDGKPFSVATEVGECPWNLKHQLLHVGIQGKRMENSALPSSNLVFLIDVSGSMDEPDKLPLVKKSLRMLVKELKDQDRIAMVVYAGNSGLVLPSTPCSQKDRIIEALDRLQAGGSTAGAAGIQQAYEVAKANFLPSGNNRVILCTDGDFNVGVNSDADLTALIEKKREDGIFLSVLGFGMGNYKDSKMEKLADKGNGNYAYIDNLAEAKKNLVTQMGGTLLTIAKDVKIQVEFNPAKVKAYRLIGYENRALADKDFNDDKKDAGEIGAGVSVTALYEIITDENDPSLKEIPKTDPLKYQKNDAKVTRQNGDELLTVKIRYKEPKASASQLLEFPVKNEVKTLAETSDNFRFASSVASFGMLLRESKFKGNFTYDKVKELATGAQGKDTEGYRAEFIKLVSEAKGLPNVAQK